MKQISGLLASAIQDIRSLSKTLDSDTVQRFGLRESLHLELDRIDKTGRFQTILNVNGTPYSLGEQTETVLFRMTQEALNNAIKHSSSHVLTVSLDYQPTSFTLTVTDNGKGFVAEEVYERDLNHNGSGLRNLERRAKLLGGTCVITSKPNDGTRIEISVPRSSNT
ncbi:hypothetical protein GCM10023189_09020 [Nibrella saemangeumensis]|uniref:histidine kinase n=1 Tax=Nibrella saemangeumensis TaxID=1084526 RepID=A0ABP8MF38_9BACT